MTAWRRFRHHAPAMIGLGIIVTFVVLALLAPVISPYDPNAQDLLARLLPPAWADGGTIDHLLGTDQLGRDVLSRLLHGSRVSLLVGVAAALQDARPSMP